MKTPFTWDLSVPITITKCETTAVGGDYARGILAELSEAK
jgi:hypothetical protein